MNSIIKFIVVLLTVIICINPLQLWAQKESKRDKAAKITGLVHQKEFVFIAQTALPMSGSMRQLNTNYDLVISTDSIISFLPYFGRAFTPPIDPSKNSLDFVSTKFAYTMEPTRKSNYNITIEPKDSRDIRILNLFVSSNGSATLTVTHFNKQPITFRGYVTRRQNT